VTNYKKILVGIDLSEIGEVLVQKALMLGSAFGPEVVFAHVIDYVPPNYVKAEIPEIYASEDIMKERAEKNIRELISKFTDQEYDLKIRVGKRKAGLIAIAEQIQADLIIMGKHDSNAVDKILGSTTHAVVNNASCDVLVIHG